ncbi:TetR/AcrR family transcriptional regulator [Nocardiopsis alba]|uniref:Bacterial regulatory s, tetR family protein n=1 Tax=Nocardiopsis alba (strain ATCC BAA-2165 / BE74) TaxID=1205910 RepID=J7L5I1_NOCAA|nr:TetR/AcrR family transcriptional regulator [Nocardiopsis alba]AFR08908.1 bacterial regulatory s, tetR family protein [Nocardiopsis alba ATCC BAA-2165]
MPRTADHDERRIQVAEALLRTVARKGLARTTLADIADEMGVSVGLVQRYFRSKTALLRFGVEHLYRRGEERLLAEEPALPIHDFAYRLALTLLPQDEERRLELTVWLEFLPATVTDPEMARMHGEATRAVIDMFTRVLAAARERGELAEGLDPAQEARALDALIDGLTMHQLTNPDLYGDADSRAMLRRHLDRLFTAGEDTDERNTEGDRG